MAFMCPWDISQRVKRKPGTENLQRGSKDKGYLPTLKGRAWLRWWQGCTLTIRTMLFGLALMSSLAHCLTCATVRQIVQSMTPRARESAQSTQAGD